MVHALSYKAIKCLDHECEYASQNLTKLDELLTYCRLMVDSGYIEVIHGVEDQPY